MSDLRPADCRFRLQDEGKPYPRSSCAACGRTITTGLGRECSRPVDRIAQLERELAEARAERDRLKRENHDLGNEIDSLEEEGCDTDDTIRKLEAERDRLAAEVERLTALDLVLVETALDHASFALDGVIAMDDEDMGKDGGSATCQATKKTVDRALSMVRASLQRGEKQG